jgi:wyosine [tRNA(Phe)-imidazoG37] synthetase (radical SAM superfamily)
MTLELKRGITYGPVSSRRLGRSLGINLLPPHLKLCSFDCVYCQYGPTQRFEASGLERELPTVEQVTAAVEAALRHLTEPPQWLTFSGNGEPTLHPDFPAMVDAVVSLRDRLCPGARTAVLSCSACAGRPEVAVALRRLDARIMKLDVGSQAMLEAYNRPGPGVTMASIVDGLSRVGDLTLQTLVAGGEEGNFATAALKAWLERVVELRPSRVQLYTLARPTASEQLAPVTRHELDALARALVREGVEAEVF